MILPNDVTIVKADITEKVGQKIFIKGTLGKNKFFEKEATIEKVYPNIFTVKYENQERSVTYSYKDILTKTIELNEYNGIGYTALFQEIDVNKKIRI